HHAAKEHLSRPFLVGGKSAQTALDELPRPLLGSRFLHSWSLLLTRARRLLRRDDQVMLRSIRANVRENRCGSLVENAYLAHHESCARDLRLNRLPHLSHCVVKLDCHPTTWLEDPEELREACPHEIAVFTQLSVARYIDDGF